VRRLIGSTRLEECSRCGGTWLDSQTFASVVGERDEQAALATALPGPSGAPRPSRESTVRYVQCPQCARLMNRENFGRRSGVVIDVCRAHGVWCDGGELGDVVAFVMRGGLDETRKRELAEAKEELRRKRSETLGEPAGSGVGDGFSDPTEGGGPSLLDMVFGLFR
jgi:Zn-finger nucleic acid-binding protein